MKSQSQKSWNLVAGSSFRSSLSFSQLLSSATPCISSACVTTTFTTEAASKVCHVYRHSSRLSTCHRMIEDCYHPLRLDAAIGQGVVTCKLETVNATLWVTRNREGPPLDTAMIYGRYSGNADKGLLRYVETRVECVVL
ncbi:unnamed protein product [Arabidopsis halleri]